MIKYRKQIIYVFIFLVIILIGIYIYPIRIYKEYSGIIYRLGDSSYQETIEVTIDGYLSDGFFSRNKFEGTIIIGEKKLSKLKMYIDKYGRGDLSYYDEELGEFPSFGTIYMKNVYEEITITVLERKEPNSSSMLWTSEDGLMISAPAGNRDEALKVSKDLMNDVLMKEVLRKMN